MPNSSKFANISSTLLNSLDRDLPGWQDLIPAEKHSKLNEESLVKLLKDRKRANTYRTIADRRNAFLKEAYEGSSSKLFLELLYEFSAFAYSQMDEWFEIESKLSSIILDFRAQPKKDPAPIKIEALDKSFDTLTDNVEQKIDLSIDSFNHRMGNYLEGFFSKNVDGKSRAGSDELKGFLRVKVDQFKEEHRQLGRQQKEFVNNSIKKLIKDKLEKIKVGELPADALNKTDLFTKEETNSIAEAQKKLITDAVINRLHSNINSVNEMAQQFIGVSGKENILQKLDECPESIVTPEVKKIVADAMDCGLMFEEEEESNGKTRSIKKRFSVYALCTILDMVAYEIEQFEDWRTTQRFKQDKIYDFCNYQIGFWAHIVTWGFCTGYTLRANWDAAIDGQSIDYKGIANLLSGISFFIGIFTAKNLIDELVKKITQALENELITQDCAALEELTEIKDISAVCSIAIFSKDMKGNLVDIYKVIRETMKKHNLTPKMVISKII